MLLKSGAKLFPFHSHIPQALTQPTGGSTRLSCFPQMPAAFPAAAKRKFSPASVPRRAAAAETAFRVGSQSCGELYVQGLNWKEALGCRWEGGGRQS